MPTWTRIAAKSDLPADNEVREFTIGDKVICVANIGGQYSALDNICLHRGGPLGQGVVLDGKIVCPWHGWLYDPKSGAPDARPQEHVTVYPIKVKGEEVLIEV